MTGTIAEQPTDEEQESPEKQMKAEEAEKIEVGSSPGPKEEVQFLARETSQSAQIEFDVRRMTAERTHTFESSAS